VTDQNQESVLDIKVCRYTSHGSLHHEIIVANGALKLSMKLVDIFIYVNNADILFVFTRRFRSQRTKNVGPQNTGAGKADQGILARGY
jgi:hypothetical protein